MKTIFGKIAIGCAVLCAVLLAGPLQQQAEAADYFVTSDEYGNQYYVVTESISKVSDWAECDVKLVTSGGGKLLGVIHYQYEISNGDWVFKASNYNYGREWHSLTYADYYQKDLFHFVMNY
ncbi:MAG: hypothetical protein MR669_07675 [Selenomonadaceae bacterium]|nr:hypothetical protein [Selenomonadaceae bacterium]